MRLTKILLGAGRRPEAEKLREVALALSDDPKIRDALSLILTPKEPGA